MTEYWVSHSKHWCELCKCWLNDTPASRAHHEQGIGHKTAVQKKLREMRKKADDEKKEAADTKRALAGIEKAAEKAYQRDMQAQDDAAPPLPPPSHPPPQLGSWEKQAGSEYLYNSTLRWYYDVKTGFYYGGEPCAWTKDPPIPKAALYENVKPAVATKKTVIRPSKPHPQSLVGGYTAPVEGRVARGAVSGQPAKAGSKRAREEPPSGAVSAEEAEEVRKREEARKRVQARTAAAFGLR